MFLFLSLSRLFFRQLGGGPLLDAGRFQLCDPGSLFGQPRHRLLRLLLGHPAGLQVFFIHWKAFASRPSQRCFQGGAANQVAGAFFRQGVHPIVERFGVDRRAQLLQLGPHPVGSEYRRVDRVVEAQLAVLGHHQTSEA